MAIPHFGDQWANAAEIVRVGSGIRMELHDLNVTSIHGAIDMLLEDGSYKQRAVGFRNKLLDQVIKKTYCACTLNLIQA